MNVTRCWYIYRPQLDRRETHPQQGLEGGIEVERNGEPHIVTANEVLKIYQSGIDRRTTLDLKDGGIAFSHRTVRQVGEDLGFVK